MIDPSGDEVVCRICTFRTVQKYDCKRVSEVLANDDDGDTLIMAAHGRSGPGRSRCCDSNSEAGVCEATIYL
jgi:hypothetical protein